MNASFEDWLACQRMYNVTPSVVDAPRVFEGVVKVRFLAQVPAGSDSPRELYDEDNVLAAGFVDEDETVELLLVKDTYRAEPCLVLVRSAPSYFDNDDSFALEVEVYDVAVGQATLVERVRQACTEDSFEDLSEETRDEEERDKGVAAALRTPSSSGSSHAPFGGASRRPARPFSPLRDDRPWWKRLFS